VAYTFKGGVHVEEHKNTCKIQTERMPAPPVVTIPMAQHIGKPATPVVKKGDTVLRGQLIGEVTGGALGCPVHSSVSGKVREFKEMLTPQGARVQCCVIENDGLDTLSPDIKPFGKKLSDSTFEEIVEIIRAAGISGMGGAGFPTYAKIQSAKGKVEHLIVNCAECEPYITCNHRLLLEDPAAVINGLKILLWALELRQGDIAVEDNKLDAVNKLEKLTADTPIVNVRVMKTKYPQGDERQLISALYGRDIPAGKLPADVGCVIFNADTCAAIYNAFANGMPLIERPVTVDGDCVRDPKNVIAPIGAPLSSLVEYCGGLKRKPVKIITGGPMMGQAQWDYETPVIKGTSALLVQSKRTAIDYGGQSACIHCGRCLQVCQMYLMPKYLAMFSQAGRIDMCEKYDALSCVECGSCTYICPGHVPITQYIRAAKFKINEQRAAERARIAREQAELAAKEAAAKEAEAKEAGADDAAAEKTAETSAADKTDKTDKTEGKEEK